MKKIILSISFFVFIISSFAQTGPAGVGSSTSNILWNRSEDLSSLNNGDRISTWSDNSGNNNDLSQDTTLFKPEYVTGQQNGFPVVRFNQNLNRLIKTSFSDFPTTAITVFMVNKNDNQATDGLFSYATTTANTGNDFLLFNSSSVQVFLDASSSNSSESINDDNWHIIDASWENSAGRIELWKDNDFKYTANSKSGYSFGSDGCLAIAGEQDDVNAGYAANQDHNGDFLEIIVYNIELNSAQRVIVGNYLAAKYALTISNDKFAYQSTHSHELAGIGRFDASNTHTAAQSANLITIDNASAMGADGEYLLFAHDDGSIAAWTATGSAYNTQKVAREWRIDETGDVGTVDITLNENDLPSLPSGHTMYGIMVDADGDFTSGAKVYELASSGSDFKATGIDIADGNYMSIVAIKPTVQFSTTTGNAVETSNASANVELNYYPASSVTVDYATSDGTATTADNDYTAVAGTTLTFSAGTIEQTASVTVIDNAISEGNEDFTITISSPSAGLNLGTSTIYTHTIIDDDNTRKINFSSASSANSESTTSVNIQVTISSADASNATTADYTVTGGTATGGGVDYTLASGTVTISAGTATTADISLSINNDALDEDNETIIIELSNSSNASLGTTTQHTYTINDDDATPTVYFTTTSASGAESVSSKNVEVKLSAASSKDVTVSFATSGTASSGTDYSISTSSPITIAAGNTTNNISLSITNDLLQEDNETVILTLSAPTNATLGANNPYTYTINDDDVIAPDGPGGVGGSAYLKLWVKAEDIPGSSDGDKIGTWLDKSGNSNNLTQSNNTYKPAYYDNVVNGFPVVRFGVDDMTRLVKTSFTDFPTSEITFYHVRKATNIVKFGEYSYAVSANPNGNEFMLYNVSKKLTLYREGAGQATNVIPTENVWNILGTVWSTSIFNLYVNGFISYNSSSTNNNSITTGGCLAIGAEQESLNGDYNTDDDFEGDFSEVIIYNNALNPVRNNIINNYLSAKYNITMAANDKYAGDTPANGNYDFEVIGIGQESTGNHLEAHTSGGLWIKQATNFGNGDYLFIGHNHITPQLYTPTEDAGLTAVSIDERWGRDWYFDLTDAGGAMTVDLTFDFDEAEMNSAASPNGTVSNYKLLYRSGTSGNWSIVAPASSITTSQILFTGQALADGDGYYALGTIDATASPLPIELMSFDAQFDNKNVVLKWETASETNNDYFEIYRSANTEQWTKLGVVDGSGTINTIRSYSFTDNQALQGISYYKLKQVDFDGKYTFSQIRSVNMELSEGIEIYPNPTNGIVYINKIDEGSRIEILDMNSRLVELDVIYSGNTVKIDMKNLAKSVYFIRVISTDSIKTFKLIKN